LNAGSQRNAARAKAMCSTAPARNAAPTQRWSPTSSRIQYTAPSSASEQSARRATSRIRPRVARSSFNFTTPSATNSPKYSRQKASACGQCDPDGKISLSIHAAMKMTVNTKAML